MIDKNKIEIMAKSSDGYVIRPLRLDDIDEYYKESFCPLDPEVVKMTGCKSEFTYDEVSSFAKNAINADDRYDFVVVSPEGKLIGETVINEIEPDNMCANFRIAMFGSDYMGKGIGSWVVQETVHFAFETLKLHRLELDVFSINPRAKKAYEKAGFKVEGVRKEAILSDGEYIDDIFMAILDHEWKEMNNIKD